LNPDFTGADLDGFGPSGNRLLQQINAAEKASGMPAGDDDGCYIFHNKLSGIEEEDDLYVYPEVCWNNK
jgi:hypothetical protein